MRKIVLAAVLLVAGLWVPAHAADMEGYAEVTVYRRVNPNDYNTPALYDAKVHLEVATKRNEHDFDVRELEVYYGGKTGYTWRINIDPTNTDSVLSFSNLEAPGVETTIYVEFFDEQGNSIFTRGIGNVNPAGGKGKILKISARDNVCPSRNPYARPALPC